MTRFNKSGMLASLLLLGAARSAFADGHGGLKLAPGQCGADECGTGYSGSGSITCASNGGDFGLSGCAPMCVLPTSTTGYDVSSCVTTGAAITDAACTVSCASGYRSTGDGPMSTCSSGFGVFTLSGCEAIPSCTLPSSTTGYTTGGCAASTTAMTETQCTAACDTANGYAGSAADSCVTDGGMFSFTGCDFACTLPTDTALTTGYDTSNCAGTKTSEQCSVTCASGYDGTPADSCSSAGGTHVLSGCTALPKCTLPATTTGYTPSSCDNTYESQCSVTCASGYTGTGTDACSTDGAEFVFGGCTPIPKCTATATTGYTIAGCNTDTNGPLEATSCTAACDTNYDGTPTETCSTDGGAFAFGGCEPQCTLPTDTSLTTGYTTSGCGGSRTAAACSVGCASGYTGTATVTCSAAGGTFTLGGCMPVPSCTLPTTNPGYITTDCNTGRGTSYGIMASQCTVSCASGYSGSATATCSSDGGMFTLAGCTRATKCILPSSTTGYLTTMCPTSTGTPCDGNGQPVSDGPVSFASQSGMHQMVAALAALVFTMMFWCQ